MYSCVQFELRNIYFYLNSSSLIRKLTIHSVIDCNFLFYIMVFVVVDYLQRLIQLLGYLNIYRTKSSQFGNLMCWTFARGCSLTTYG